MNDKQSYTGSKIRNHFTAYVINFIKSKRHKYIDKNFNRVHIEYPLKEWEELVDDVSLEEYLEIKRKERLLIDESRMVYPSWNDLNNRNLLAAILLLREEERKLIYQHMFEERGFEEMSQINAIPIERIKSIYYYAIRKLRRWMGGDLP